MVLETFIITVLLAVPVRVREGRVTIFPETTLMPLEISLYKSIKK